MCYAFFTFMDKHLVTVNYVSILESATYRRRRCTITTSASATDWIFNHPLLVDWVGLFCQSLTAKDKRIWDNPLHGCNRLWLPAGEDGPVVAAGQQARVSKLVRKVPVEVLSVEVLPAAVRVTALASKSPALTQSLGVLEPVRVQARHQPNVCRVKQLPHSANRTQLLTSSN